MRTTVILPASPCCTCWPSSSAGWSAGWLSPASMPGSRPTPVRTRTGSRLGGLSPMVGVLFAGRILDDLVLGEPDPDLVGGFFGVTRRVHEIRDSNAPVVGVGPAHVREIAADGAGRSLVGVGRADDFADARDRLDALEHHRDHRSALH